MAEKLNRCQERVQLRVAPTEGGLSPVMMHICSTGPARPLMDESKHQRH